MGVGESGIVISPVVDRKTGSVNDLFTLGGTLKLTGDHPYVGVSFEEADENPNR